MSGAQWIRIEEGCELPTPGIMVPVWHEETLLCDRGVLYSRYDEEWENLDGSDIQLFPTHWLKILSPGIKALRGKPDKLVYLDDKT